MGICIKSLKTFVCMLETAISLLESYPKEKESDNHKGVIYGMFIAAYLKCKKKKKKKKGRTN